MIHFFQFNATEDIEPSIGMPNGKKIFIPFWSITVVVRALFHEKSSTQFDIIIEPKMSFGTGHHETTHMMIRIYSRL